jgi:hypothetical protein
MNGSTLVDATFAQHFACLHPSSSRLIEKQTFLVSLSDPKPTVRHHPGDSRPFSVLLRRAALQCLVHNRIAGSLHREYSPDQFTESRKDLPALMQRYESASRASSASLFSDSVFSLAFATHAISSRWPFKTVATSSPDGFAYNNL